MFVVVFRVSVVVVVMIVDSTVVVCETSVSVENKSVTKIDVSWYSIRVMLCFAIIAVTGDIVNRHLFFFI